MFLFTLLLLMVFHKSEISLGILSTPMIVKRLATSVSFLFSYIATNSVGKSGIWLPNRFWELRLCFFAFQGKSFALGKHLLNFCFCHALSLLVGGKDTFFSRNFQGFRGKCGDDDDEKISVSFLGTCINLCLGINVSKSKQEELGKPFLRLTFCGAAYHYITVVQLKGL